MLSVRPGCGHPGRPSCAEPGKTQETWRDRLASCNSRAKPAAPSWWGDAGLFLGSRPQGVARSADKRTCRVPWPGGAADPVRAEVSHVDRDPLLEGRQPCRRNFRRFPPTRRRAGRGVDERTQREAKAPKGRHALMNALSDALSSLGSASAVKASSEPDATEEAAAPADHHPRAEGRPASLHPRAFQCAPADAGRATVKGHQGRGFAWGRTSLGDLAQRLEALAQKLGGGATAPADTTRAGRCPADPATTAQHGDHRADSGTTTTGRGCLRRHVGGVRGDRGDRPRRRHARRRTFRYRLSRPSPSRRRS